MRERIDSSTPGLRERKKARTRAEIRRRAFDLFARQGYSATTVEQIVTAAEVSESTFFRYFPSKEDLVLTDDLYARFALAFRTQPDDLSLAAALRAAVRGLFGAMSADELRELRERSLVVFAVPELRRAALVQLADGTDLVADLVAERVGREAGDAEVRVFAGAVTGVFIALVRGCAAAPDANMLDAVDEAMRFIEAGLPLEQGVR